MGSGPLLIILIFLFMLIQGLIPAIQLFSSKQIIDGISAKGESSDISIIWACIYAISMILMVLLDSIKKWIGKILSERSLLSINLLLLEAWEKVPGMKFLMKKISQSFRYIARCYWMVTISNYNGQYKFYYRPNINWWNHFINR